MTEKTFLLQLTGTQLNLIGNAVEQTKASLDVLSMNIQAQVNAQLAAEAAAAEKREKPTDAPAETRKAGAAKPRRDRKRKAA